MFGNYIMYILMIENKGYLNPLTFSINIIIFKFGPALVFGPKKDKVFSREKFFLIKNTSIYQKQPQNNCYHFKNGQKICQTFFSLMSLKICQAFFSLFFDMLKKWGIFYILRYNLFKINSSIKLILGQKIRWAKLKKNEIY